MNYCCFAIRPYPLCLVYKGLKISNKIGDCSILLTCAGIKFSERELSGYLPSIHFCQTISFAPARVSLSLGAYQTKVNAFEELTHVQQVV